MYKSEAAFGRALGAALKRRGAVVTRIETGLTSQGVPDMFVQFNGDLWLELKNEPDIDHSDLSKMLMHNTYTAATIHWRPGQQAWALNYYNKHNKNKCSLTVVACNDFFMLIPMTKHYHNNKVDIGCFDYYKTLDMLVREILRRSSKGE